MHKKLILATLAAGFILLTSAALSAEKQTTTPVYAETHTKSGFLGNYDDFKVINQQTQALVWIRPPHKDFSILNEYDSIVFSPIEIWMDPSSSYKGVDPNELKVITDYFLESLNKELGSTYKIVEKSGPGVMNIRIAITSVSKTKPDYKKVINLLPVKLAWELGNAAYRKATSQAIDVFEAQAELEILDSESGERLVAAIDKHQVKDTRKKDEETNWDSMQEILDYWSNTISNRLTVARKN